MADRLSILFEKYINNKCSNEELREFWALIARRPDNSFLTQELKAVWNDTSNQSVAINKQELFAKVLGRAKSSESHIPKRITNWTRIAAAASIFLLLSVSGYFILRNEGSKQIATTETQPIKNDVSPPASNKAMITLDNGQQLLLDSIGNGILTTQGGVNIIKNEKGEIVYNGTASSVTYNTLNNPRGSKVVNLKLQDGTKIWLNAGSSLKYPTAFIGSERKVEITGEAYFEVAHNTEMPFVVQKSNVSVEVLGTHFNVNAYDDEVSIRITLLEGSVKVSTAKNSHVLKPGQQAILPQTQEEIKIEKASVEQVMAWKNGFFSFQNADIQTVMRQLSRWYNVEVQYQDAVSKQQFSGKIGRGLTLSEVLKGLEQTRVHFKIEEGKRIVILP